MAATDSDTQPSESPSTVTDDARAEAERNLAEIARDADLTFEWGAGYKAGFREGAEWAAGRAETTTEGTRWYVPAYRTPEPNSRVQRLGSPTVLREYAERELEAYRKQEADDPEGNPDAIFLATRLEYPWEEAGPDGEH